MLKGNVLITGGSGFLGRGIMARAAKENWPCNFTVYSRDEYKQDLCKRKHPDASYVLGDIRDIERLELTMLRQDIVIHAAALKYVPEAESNVGECIAINVGGTTSVAMAVRHSNNVKTMVNISTDKAVEPLNTYGLTKALGERIMCEYARLDDERSYTSCRYGNVVGSTGSVVPVFKRHAERGVIPVTDPDMTRFWISIDDAVDLVLEAACLAVSGSIVIPVPQSMRLGDLVVAVAPGVRVNIIGVRPGEKYHEKLMTLKESAKASFIEDENRNLYWYTPNLESVDQVSVELSSDTADKMTTETFRKLVEAAELI